MKDKTVLTKYAVGTGARTLRLAVASDLHNSTYGDIVPLLREARPID